MERKENNREQRELIVSLYYSARLKIVNPQLTKTTLPGNSLFSISHSWFIALSDTLLPQGLDTKDLVL